MQSTAPTQAAAETSKQVQQHINTSRRMVSSLKAKADRKRTFSDRLADRLTTIFGSPVFLAVNFIWFTLWVVINLGFVPFVKPFDPFPFGFLTMVVSLEAIMLAIVVLISQNRAATIADLREEVDLQIDIIAEQEVTKLIYLMNLLLEKEGIDISTDEELKQMIEPINLRQLEHTLERQILSR